MKSKDQIKRGLRATIKRFFEPAFIYKKDFLISLLQVTSRPIYGIVTTLVIAKAVSHLQFPNEHKFFSVLIWFGVFVVIYQIYNYILRNALRNYSWNSFSYLFRKYFAHYVKLDNNKTEVIGTGKMLSIIDKGIEYQSELNNSTMYLGMSGLVQLIFVTYLLTKVTWFAPLLLYVFLVITLLISSYLKKGGNVWRRKRDDMRDEATRHTVKILMSKFEILLNSKVEKENNRFAEISEKIKYYDCRKMFFEHRSFNVPTIMITVITISLFVFLGYKFFYENTMTYSDIVLYLGLVNSLDRGTRDIINLYATYAKNFQRVTRLWKTFDEMPEMKGYDEGAQFAFKEGNISFHDVSFNYGENEVVHKLSFDMVGGKKTALVGISGGGKSTIIKLIAGYLSTSKGHITVDGQILPGEKTKKAVSLQSYYKHIGYLTQEPNVFDGSIYDNLTYALDRKPSHEEIETAIQQSQCQFVNDFKDGLRTEIGEKGIRLSGGQRQRLAIAKIFLKNPEIVLLDEPTSALDSLSEEAITKAMHNLFKGRTVIIIAHRLQTVKHADDIIVLEEGKVIERGTHAQLVKEGGHYAKMLELQSGF